MTYAKDHTPRSSWFHPTDEMTTQDVQEINIKHCMKIMDDKNYRLLIDAEKAFNKTHHPFITKALKYEIQSIFNITKAIYI